MGNNYHYRPVGDRALLIEVGSEISPDINRRVHRLNSSIAAAGIRGITATVPTYCSLLVHYDPLLIRYGALRQALEQLSVCEDGAAQISARVIEIPICYGGDFGPDLNYVAQYHKMTPQEVISIHSGCDYLIYMLGFIAGYPYLGGIDKRIATPRLQVPRTRIEGGSVGIGGDQIGIYPLPSPGGFQLIGRTPLRLFSADSSQVSLLSAGDYIRFLPIRQEEFAAIRRDVEAGSYQCQMWQKEA